MPHPSPYARILETACRGPSVPDLRTKLSALLAPSRIPEPKDTPERPEASAD